MKYTGAMFEKAVRNSDISLTVLARKLRVNRRTIYNWFEKDIISIDIIYRVSKVIGIDFFQHFPGLELTRRPAGRTGGPRKSETASFWKAKYAELLEQYNELLLRVKQKQAS